MNKGSTVFCGVFVLLGMSGIIFGMEADQNKNNTDTCFSLFIKNNGHAVVKRCTVDASKIQSLIVQQSAITDHIVTTIPVQYKKIKKVLCDDYARINELINIHKKFLLKNQALQEEYVINQVIIKSWPLQWDEMKRGNYESVNKYLTRDAHVYDLCDSDPNLTVLNCRNHDVVQGFRIVNAEPLNTIAVCAFILYFYSKNPMTLTFLTT
jgi:hypothetical protein